MRKLATIVLALIAGLVLLFFVGPREKVDESISFSAIDLGDDLDGYLQEREAKISNITPGAEKQIVWQNPNLRDRRPWAIVYLHGFSATLEEVRPLPDLVAEKIDANIFYTRLKGHGRDGDAMAEPSVNDWYNDVAEAIAIGEKLGERVLLITTSTGGSLATWAVSKPEFAEKISGSVFISPNYGVVAAGSEILSFPWARQILPLIFGRDRSFEPRNPEQGKWWTTKYPNVALLPMQASVNRAVEVSFEAMTTPALFIYHPQDGVVRSDITNEVAGRWGKNGGARVDVEVVNEAEDAYNHVIAGRILSPANTVPLANRVIEWVAGL